MTSRTPEFINGRHHPLCIRRNELKTLFFSAAKAAALLLEGEIQLRMYDIVLVKYPSILVDCNQCYTNLSA
jgi:hypothetical protein